MVLFYTFLIASWAWAAAPETKLNAPFDSTWLEHVVLIFTGSTMCAGTVLTPGDQVLTSYHCVASGGRPSVRFEDGRSVVGTIARVDVKHDLALIRLQEEVSEGLVLRAEEAGLTEAVWAVGHPFGLNTPAGFLDGTLRWSVSEGIVSNRGVRAIQITAPVNSGNSGGPVLSREGEILGVVSRRIPGDGMGFATRADAAQTLLGAEDRNPPSLIGGTFALQLVGSSIGGWLYTAGPEVVFALRDRVVLRGNIQVPLGIESVSQETDWVGGELSGGLRQRFLRGPYAIRLDVYGGMADVNGVRLDESGKQTAQRLEWLAGAGLSVRRMGFDVGLVGGQPRWLIRLKWPGVVTVF
jgi:hypothetical protein